MKLDVFSIKCIMAEQRLTVYKLAELSQLSRSNLSTILCRESCSTVNAGRIAHALGVEVKDIAKED